jgi:hypothetical protein
MILERWALNLLGWVKGLLDESVPPERLRAFLAAGLKEADLSAGRALLPREAEQELVLARSLAARAGLLPPLTSELPSAREADPQALGEAEAWLTRLGDQKIISRAGLAIGTGAALTTFLVQPASARSFSLESTMEALLRHIETRRQSGLSLSPASEGSDPWMEWLAVAILFSRASRLWSDLRFLNAAVKLNDWGYPSHRHLRLGPRLARYLLSLAEQEAAYEELR